MSGSELYRREMALCEEQGDPVGLMQMVWGGTPWMAEAFTGPFGGRRCNAMRQWCRDHYGPEAWPIYGPEAWSTDDQPGAWHGGGTSIEGWTRFGFATEIMMREFLKAWPAPDDAPPLPELL